MGRASQKCCAATAQAASAHGVLGARVGTTVERGVIVGPLVGSGPASGVLVSSSAGVRLASGVQVAMGGRVVMTCAVLSPPSTAGKLQASALSSSMTPATPAKITAARAAGERQPVN